MNDLTLGVLRMKDDRIRELEVDVERLTWMLRELIESATDGFGSAEGWIMACYGDEDVAWAMNELNERWEARET